MQMNQINITFSSLIEKIKITRTQKEKGEIRQNELDGKGIDSPETPQPVRNERESRTNSLK